MNAYFERNFQVTKVSIIYGFTGTVPFCTSGTHEKRFTYNVLQKYFEFNERLF
jgi:hypothetical protein